MNFRIYRLSFIWTALVTFILLSCTTSKKNNSTTYPITGVAFNMVQVNDDFWLPKIEINRTTTIPTSFKKCEETGRVDNFLIAGGKMEGPVKGDMPFDDTDLYKIIEGASYSMTTIPDKQLDAYVDSLITIIAIGQEEDGYLTTYKTIDTTNAPAGWCPAGSRWKDLACSHELYNSGHMFEAAAAHYQATGKTNFLDIATKNADLLVSVFGKGKNQEVPGHQIVETGLIKLYMITQKQEYLDLARYFLDGRGDTLRRTKIWGPYSQDHKLVINQDEAVGHAVRAAYMYAGMTDIAALHADTAYSKAVDKIWDNVVSRKMYITGGIGSTHSGEAFGENYELPNLTSYNETCAAIANVYWNYRMFLLHGDSKYIDVLERSLYNGVISGVSLDGKNFFYPNPLSCNMEYHFNRGALERQPWFDCSCCPSNLCRFMPSVPGYIYAYKQSNIFVNLYVQSSTTVNLDEGKVTVSQVTEYPWQGNVKISVEPEQNSRFTLKLRVPGWVSNSPVASDLYSYVDGKIMTPRLLINGNPIEILLDKGYAIIEREWQRGDVVEFDLPMEVRKVIAHEKVKENIGKVAFERGPIVYCLEQLDNPSIDSVKVKDDISFSTSFENNLLNGVVTISAFNNDSTWVFKAIPYYAWNNRGASKMDVWLKY